MSVYVDDAIHGYGRMIMCHMVSPDLDELHAMADRIGVQRKWFQNPLTMPKVSRPHYDIAKSKRVLAVAAGARPIDRYQMSVISTHALNVLLAASGRPGRLDPIRLFRRWDEDRVAAMEAWLADEVGQEVVDQSRALHVARLAAA